MKKLAAVAVKAALWVAGIAAVLVAALLIVNSRLFDEAPNPEIAAFMKLDAPNVPDEQNAFFYFVGLAAPASEEPLAVGKKQVLDARETQARRLKGDFTAKWPALSRMPALPQKICQPELGSCLQQAKNGPGAMQKLVASSERVVSRYRAAHAYADFGDTSEESLVDYPMMLSGSTLNAQRVFLMDAAFRIERGELQAVLGDVGKDIALARRMLAGSRSVISKITAARMLNRSVLFASDVLAKHGAQTGGASELLILLQPLTPAERQMGDAIRTEFRVLKTTVENGLAYPEQFKDYGFWMEDWYRRVLVQPNATSNGMYAAYRVRYAAAMVPADQLDAALLKMQEPPQVQDWTLIYNPYGKAAIQDSIPNFTEYFLRIHDLDALVRLVALQAQMAAKGVKDDGVPQFLESADKRYANPWTGKPMQWDAGTRQIYFEPRSSSYKSEKTGGIAGRTGVTL